MLVKNLSHTDLSVRSFSGKRIVLKALKVQNIDEYEFPPERLKKLFGKYIHIMAEKRTEDITPINETGNLDDDLSKKVKKDMESKENVDVVSVTTEAITKEEETDDNGMGCDVQNLDNENVNNDICGNNPVCDTVTKENKEQVTSEEKPADKTAKSKEHKGSRKSNKKK